MFENILVAVDGSKHSDAAFDVAIDIAQKYDSQLFVLHIYLGGTGYGTLVSPGYDDDMRDIGQQILDSYEARSKKRRYQNVRMLLQEGDAAKRIMETANEINCRLLIMGSRGRGGFKELLLGSVSQKVVNHAGCPILIVK